MLKNCPKNRPLFKESRFFPQAEKSARKKLQLFLSFSKKSRVFPESRDFYQKAAMAKMGSPDFFKKVPIFSKKSPFWLKWLIFQKLAILAILLYTNTFLLLYKYFKTLLYLKIKPCKDKRYKICIHLSKVTMVIELLFSLLGNFLSKHILSDHHSTL